MDNKARCPNCKGLHEISWRVHFGFVACPNSGKTYVAGVNGLTMPGPLDRETEVINRLRAEYGIYA